MTTKMMEPRDLLLHELGDLLYAEKQLVKTLPTLAKEARDRELSAGFESHLDETRQHVTNLEQVFEALGEKPTAEKCPGIDGIREEHDTFMAEHDASPEVSDLFLAGAGSRAEHYEIAAYRGVIEMARALGHDDCVPLLEANLKQEEGALMKLETSTGKLLSGAAAHA